MVETATRQSDVDIATGSHMGRHVSGLATALNEAGGAQPLDRQASADRFRMLMAKLKKGQTEPAIAETPPAPAPETQIRAAFQIEPAPPPAMQSPVELTEPPHAQTLSLEPETETTGPVAEGQEIPLPPHPGAEQDPLPAEEPAAQVAAGAAPQENEADCDDREHQSDADSMSDELAEISRAVYAVPSAADRAAFFSEVVRMVSIASTLEQIEHEPLDLIGGVK